MTNHQESRPDPDCYPSGEITKPYGRGKVTALASTLFNGDKSGKNKVNSTSEATHEKKSIYKNSVSVFVWVTYSCIAADNKLCAKWQ
jgi:hypothetical protein